MKITAIVLGAIVIAFGIFLIVNVTTSLGISSGSMILISGGLILLAGICVLVGAILYRKK